MNGLTRRLRLLTIGLAALALAAASDPVQARGNGALRFGPVATQARAVVVKVTNPTDSPRRVTVVARVVTTRGVVALVASQDVPANQSGTVRMDLPTTALDVPPLGVVVDDGVPF